MKIYLPESNFQYQSLIEEYVHLFPDLQLRFEPATFSTLWRFLPT